MLNFTGNLIWLLFGGLTAAGGMMAAGFTTCATIIGIPFGIEQIRVGYAMLTPFGREVLIERETTRLEKVLNLAWFVLFGWALVINHLFFGAILTLTVVGIPFARQHWKLTLFSAFPFGKKFGKPRRPAEYTDGPRD
ncbi:MAG: YccF domain-containing protein [Vulcanimicrobiota bacterium]